MVGTDEASYKKKKKQEENKTAGIAASCGGEEAGGDRMKVPFMSAQLDLHE